MYKSEYICSFHCKSIEQNDVEVIEYGGEIWINQNSLQKKLDITNIADRIQYYSSKLKKMRCEIQECHISTLQNFY